mmetsp:Transcript_53554/g.138439  ORF Transcript_53554/g.138439 Transcript_53554/m.138439 type:complete len:242 (+) Transcript_53554:1634-2359(+)
MARSCRRPSRRRTHRAVAVARSRSCPRLISRCKRCRCALSRSMRAPVWAAVCCCCYGCSRAPLRMASPSSVRCASGHAAGLSSSSAPPSTSTSRSLVRQSHGSGSRSTFRSRTSFPSTRSCSYRRCALCPRATRSTARPGDCTTCSPSSAPSRSSMRHRPHRSAPSVGVRGCRIAPTERCNDRSQVSTMLWGRCCGSRHRAGRHSDCPVSMRLRIARGSRRRGGCGGSHGCDGCAVTSLQC